MTTPQKTHEVTQLLVSWGNGDEAALQALIPLVHSELRRIAKRHMNGERPGHTLQTTALVNEAYLRLVDWKNVRWENRSHFFAVSAQMMRRILVDFARQRATHKRDAGVRVMTLDGVADIGQMKDDSLIALDDALNALHTLDERKSRIVELRFFGGLSVEETAEVLKISRPTVIREWTKAKAWLYRELSNTEVSDE